MCQPFGGLVTTQPMGQSAAAAPTAAERTKPFRQLIAYVLLAGTAVLLLVAFARLFLVFDRFLDGFDERLDDPALTLVAISQITAPLLAALLATHVRPMLPAARMITMVALVEIGFALVVGFIAMALGFFARAAGDDVFQGQLRDALETALIRLVL